MFLLVCVFLLLLVLLVLRMPVAFAMGVSGLVGLVVQFGPEVALTFLEQSFFQRTSSFILVAIPLFLLMAEIMTVGGMTKRAFDACNAWIGHIRGGLAYATIGASVLLAALIGSSTASSATMSAAVYPEMKRANYDDRLSSAVVCVGGTLAIMIPPSIVLIVYGVLTETSIGKLFIAGIVPGLLTALSLVVTTMILARKPGYAPAVGSFSFRRAISTAPDVWPMVLLVVFVIVAIYTGTVSPTEAAAIGVAGALIIALLHRSVTPRNFGMCLSNAVRTSAMIILIIVCSGLLGSYLTFTQVTQSMVRAIASSGTPAWVIMALMVFLLLVLGMILDQLAILALTMPLAFPIVISLGYDPVWFGIIVTKTVEVGLVSPPFGLNVYVTSGRTGVPPRTVFRGVIPFLVADLVVIVLLLRFPEIVSWLPDMMD